MEMARPDGVGAPVPVRVTNADGASPYVLVCDHASNFLPTEFGTLGLDAGELSRHIAWDPGALPVSRFMADVLDAPLIESCISRLIIDCNRSLNASNLIPSVSETTSIPGNVNISPEEKQARIDIAWRPFHAAIEKIVDDRLAAGRETRLVSIHSFTPVYMGVSRPWHVGIIHDEDRRIADPLLKGLGNIEGAVVGSNVPYSPADQVYFTLERHGRARGLACAMIEIRNDEISDQAGQRKWADVLAALLSKMEFATQPVVEQAGTHE